MLFDTHAHYYAEAFDPDRDAVLSALPAAGVGLVLCPGCDLDTSRQSIQLAEAYPHVYAAAGVHPEDALGLPVDWLDQVAEMTRHPKVKAIGEIGLDYYWKEVPRDLQKEVFRAQLQLAKVLDLPVIVHDREAHADCLAIVREFPGVRGVFHCYSGSAEDAKTLVKLGWHLSFTGTITFKNARKAPEVIAAVPLERIMVETDAPYMAPTPFRGKRRGRQNPGEAGLAPVLHRDHHLQKRPEGPGGHRGGAFGADHGGDRRPLHGPHSLSGQAVRLPLCLPNGGDHCGDQGAHPGGSGAGHHGEWQGALCHSITGGPSGPEDFWGGVFRARGYCDL